MPVPSLSRMIYIDDSGRPQSGLVVYGWIEFTPAHWNGVLRTWLDHRKSLWLKYSVPASQELHMTDYALGRGRISSSPPERFTRNGRPLWKDLGREIAEESLRVISGIEGLKAGAVYRQGAPSDWARERAAVYRALIQRFEAELLETEGLGIVFIDGDGSDRTYRSAHRELKLAERRIIEDPVHTDSSASQLIQIADHVAWSANAALSPIKAHDFAHRWYDTHLSLRDPHRRPQAI